MINARPRNVIRKRVHTRIRSKIAGTADRPRLNVFRSLNHIYTQLIDDASGTTIASASTLLKRGSGEAKGKTDGDEQASQNETKTEARTRSGNVASAVEVGKAIAERAKEKGITRVVFDRGGYLYHGRIKALADAAREAGLEF